jgi:membrane protease YdiL (CAAX protease family)
VVNHVGRQSLSVSGAIGLLAASAACWAADVGTMVAFRYVPHEYYCLMIRSGDRVLHFSSFWESLTRLGIAVLVILLLIAWNPGLRPILGMTLADLRRTALWTALACFGCVAIVFGFAASVELFYGLSGSPAPWLHYDVLTFYHPDRLYPVLWHLVVMCPLIEETSYRALPVPALERLGGRRVALVGSGLIWAALHWFYGLPWAMAPFYFCTSALTTWLFLKTRSLLPSLALHAMFNLTVVLAWYCVALKAVW